MRAATCSMSARPRTSAKRIANYARPTGLQLPHRTHGRRHRLARIRLDQNGNRGAAARSQSDQAAAPALQRAAARRQVVPLHFDHRRPLGAADPQAPRRAQPRRQILRPVRLGLGGQPHHHGAAARVPLALLLRRLLREPHAAVPVASDQALLGALHARDRVRRLCRSWCARPTPSSPARARR